MTRQKLIQSGFSVTVKHSGAEYPHYAPDFGPGWEFVLKSPDERERCFSTSESAWAFAQRLARQTA